MTHQFQFKYTAQQKCIDVFTKTQVLKCSKQLPSVAKRQKLHKCPSIGEWKNKGWDVRTSEQPRTPPSTMNSPPLCNVCPPSPIDTMTGRRSQAQGTQTGQPVCIKFGNRYSQSPVLRPGDGSFLGGWDGGAGSVLELDRVVVTGVAHGGKCIMLFILVHFICIYNILLRYIIPRKFNEKVTFNLTNTGCLFPIIMAIFYGLWVKSCQQPVLVQPLS